MFTDYDNIASEFLFSCAQNNVLIEEVYNKLNDQFIKTKKYNGSEFERSFKQRCENHEFKDFSSLTEEEEECRQNLISQPTILRKVDSLLKMGIIFQITIIEGYIKNILFNIMTKKPHVMLQFSHTICIKEILNSKNKTALIEEIARKEVDQWGYLSIDKMQEKIDKIFKFDLKSFEFWSIIRKFSLIRNLLVHNNGIINEIFLEAIKDNTLNVGQKITLTIESFLECYYAVHGFISFLYDKIVKKFNLVKNPLFWDKMDREKRGIS